MPIMPEEERNNIIHVPLLIHLNSFVCELRNIETLRFVHILLALKT